MSAAVAGGVSTVEVDPHGTPWVCLNPRVIFEFRDQVVMRHSGIGRRAVERGPHGGSAAEPKRSWHARRRGD